MNKIQDEYLIIESVEKVTTVFYVPLLFLFLLLFVWLLLVYFPCCCCVRGLADKAVWWAWPAPPLDSISETVVGRELHSGEGLGPP